MFSIFLIFVFCLGLNKELISHEFTKVMFSFQGKLTVKKSHNNCIIFSDYADQRKNCFYIIIKYV